MGSWFFAREMILELEEWSRSWTTARLRNKTTSISFFILVCFSTIVVYVLPYISQPNGYMLV